ncbi:helix-turn-helix domain-containing protein [Arachidicoccus terrestris]|uniref:helix-turn-helix domain-containing protein n=1 Tax=Arachidicoccus terrestris TaxID=2875539 RepID=UPI001CC4EF81|nr:helix-turn-helix domain-containing protein [Arachidicoccus terrestris]UAY56123.1 helix-turn-helix domain-containing protein [Arachidicoccus terrestris]
MINLYVNRYKMTPALGAFVKTERKKIKLTQSEFAERAGVALVVIRKIEQGKENLNLRKVNRVLLMFDHTLGPVKVQRESISEQ